MFTTRQNPNNMRGNTDHGPLFLFILSPDRGGGGVLNSTLARGRGVVPAFCLVLLGAVGLIPT